MSADDARKLFVGGLNDAVTEEALRELFEGAGFSIAHLALPRDRETGRVRGFAFVTLATDEEATAALTRVHGAQCGGRPISVREFSQGAPKPAQRPRGEEPTVFLGKLPFDATPDEVAQVFIDQGCGPVVRVILPAGPDGRPRGFGFAVLETPEAAVLAVERVNGASMRGRGIVVSPAQPKAPRPAGTAGFGGAGGYAGSGGAPGPWSPTGPVRGGHRPLDGTGGDAAKYEQRGPRALPRDGGPQFFPSEAPAPGIDDEGRRRKAEAQRKERAGATAGPGADRAKRSDDQYKSGKRRRGGGSSWHQWDSEDE